MRFQTEEHRKTLLETGSPLSRKCLITGSVEDMKKHLSYAESFEVRQQTYEEAVKAVREESRPENNRMLGLSFLAFQIISLIILRSNLDNPYFVALAFASAIPTLAFVSPYIYRIYKKYQPLYPEVLAEKVNGYYVSPKAIRD